VGLCNSNLTASCLFNCSKDESKIKAKNRYQIIESIDQKESGSKTAAAASRRDRRG